MTLLTDRLRQTNPGIVCDRYSLDQLGSQQDSLHKLFATAHKPIWGLNSDFTDHPDLGRQQAQIFRYLYCGSIGSMRYRENPDGVEYDLAILVRKGQTFDKIYNFPPEFRRQQICTAFKKKVQEPTSPIRL